MSTIKVIPKKDLDRFIDIQIDAYPGMGIDNPEARKKMKTRLQKWLTNPHVSIHGLYEKNELLGGLLLYDYRMSLHGTRVLVGGGGSLAVSLLHKKERVAKKLLEYYFRLYRKKKAPMAVLWPFRHDFYRRMGVGYGTRIHVFRVKPDSLPRGEGRKHIRYLTKKDIPALVACNNRYGASTTGMIETNEFEWEMAFEVRPNTRVVGYVRDGKVRGFLQFAFRKGKSESFIRNDIVVSRLVYEDREALAELLTFLHTQFDQVDRVEFRTPDETFFHLFDDPRAESLALTPPVYHEAGTLGLGLMYRVLSTRRLFEQMEHRDFGGQSCRLKLTVHDSFLRENDGSVVLHFTDGRIRLKPSGAEYDVELSMDVADLATLAMGAVDLKALHMYGQADISDVGYLDTLHRLFYCDRPPVCLTAF